MRRIKRIITTIACLVNCLPAYKEAYAQKKLNAGNSLLWRVSGKDLAKPSYVFGTMHLICPGDYIWTPKMAQSFAASEKICFEMDMDDPSVLSEITSGLIDNSGKKLEEYFTPDQFALVKRYIKDSMGMDIAMFQHMKPVVLQTMMTTNITECQSPVSYEDSLMNMAHRKHKEVLGLEQPKEQIEVLESIPTDTVIRDLMAMIQHTDEPSDSDYYNLVNAYKTQNIPLLYKLIVGSKDLGDMGVFLDGRNKKWIPRMATKMKTSSVFFAVGAGHLGGDTGVISLLRKNGYTVTPIR